jgi:hypothetical protein
MLRVQPVTMQSASCLGDGTRERQLGLALVGNLRTAKSLKMNARASSLTSFMIEP